MPQTSHVSFVPSPPRDLPLVDEVLSRHVDGLGPRFAAYRNHVCRVASLCELIAPLSDVDRRQVQIAACFHDLAIWTHHTSDYLAQSRALAEDYLTHERRAAWTTQVLRIIDDDHKIRSSRDRLAECFRRADWIDVTQGTLRFGVPRARIHELKERYPKTGFHALLVKLTLRQMLRTPWRPFPMLRW